MGASKITQFFSCVCLFVAPIDLYVLFQYAVKKICISTRDQLTSYVSCRYSRKLSCQQRSTHGLHDKLCNVLRPRNKQTNKLPSLTCLIFSAFTPHPVHCVPLLTPAPVGFSKPKEKFHGQRAVLPLGPVAWNKLPVCFPAKSSSEIKCRVFPRPIPFRHKVLCVSPTRPLQT